MIPRLASSSIVLSILRKRIPTKTWMFDGTFDFHDSSKVLANFWSIRELVANRETGLEKIDLTENSHASRHQKKIIRHIWKYINIS